MALDASIMCNCYQDGKTTEPPFPRDWLHIDEEGYFCVKDEYKPKNRDAYWEQFDKLEVWKESCCEHKRMNFALIRIANAAGWNFFRRAINNCRDGEYRALRCEFPVHADCLTMSKDAGLALKDLDRLESLEHFGTTAELVNVQSKVVVESWSGDVEYYVAKHAGGSDFVLMDREKFMLFDNGSEKAEHEFEVLREPTESPRNLLYFDSKPEQPVFKSNHFIQSVEVSSSGIVNADDIEWVDLETGERYRGGFALEDKLYTEKSISTTTKDGGVLFVNKAEYKVVERPFHVSEFEYMLPELRMALEASVKTGNPVRWF